jgi:hypothetical protein
MNCKKIYTHDFLFEKCTSTFLNKEFKKHREEVLLNQQKSYLPATQPYVMLEREREKVRLVIIELEKEKQALLAQVHAKNNQINKTDAASVTKAVSVSTNTISKKLGRTINLVKVYKENLETYEVDITIGYDTKTAKTIMIDEIKASLGAEADKLRITFESFLNPDKSNKN